MSLTYSSRIIILQKKKCGYVERQAEHDKHHQEVTTE